MNTRFRQKLLFILGCLMFFCSQAQAGDTLDIWKWRNPLPASGVFATVDYLNGQFLSFGYGPGLVASRDGTNWTAYSFPIQMIANKIAYGNGRYVVAGGTWEGGGVLASSTDLLTWTVIDTGNANRLNGVAFGNGIFIAVGSSGSYASNDYTSFISTSANGIDWTPRASPINLDIRDITFGNGQFVAVLNCPSPQALVSPDGDSWTPSTSLDGKLLNTISFAGDQFYAGGYAFSGTTNLPVLASSSDGFSWNLCSDPRTNGTPWFRVISGNGRLLGVAGSSISPLSVSTDGTNFIAIPANNYWPISGVAFKNGLFVNSRLQASLDATNWSPTAISPTNTDYFIEDIFSTTNGYLVPLRRPLLSLDGLKFTIATNISQDVKRVKFAGSMYGGVAAGGFAVFSSNGLDWDSIYSPTTNTLLDIEYGNSTWAVVGSNGTIITTSNVNIWNAWTLRPSGTSLALKGIIYGTNQFAVVGESGIILTSPDGSSWTPQAGGTPEKLNQIVYGNGQFVAVGDHGTITTSSNGMDWTPRDSGVPADLAGIAFGDGTYCATGRDVQTNVVLTSTDGISWKQRITPMLHDFPYPNPPGVRFLNGTFFIFGNETLLQSGPVIPPTLQVTFNNAIPQINAQCSSNLLLRLQSADTLNGPWEDRGLLKNSLGTGIIFPDNSAASQPQRFYRAVAP